MTAVMALRAPALGFVPRFSPERKVAFIDLDCASQQVPIWAHHGSPKSMQHGPCGLITVQAKNPLQAQGADPLLLASEVPRGSKPHSQWRSGFIEEGCGRDAALMSAGPADQPPSCGATRRIDHCACWTAKTRRPSQHLQIRGARFVAAKPVLELAQRLGVIFASNGLDLVHADIVRLVELNG